MQNSNLSAKIFPIIRDDWSKFIEKVEHELQEMMITYNNDKRRLKDLERLINKLKEITNISKDNIEAILNYKELFMYIDNSLESSFGALKLFQERNNFDNPSVKLIYERIISSPKIIKISNEYSELSIKVQFDKERIKRLGELIHGSKIDFNLIKELLKKYKLDDKTKKNVMFYPVVMLAIRQKEIKDNKVENKKEKEKFYQNRFNELIKDYQTKKENIKDLLIRCFNVRKSMKPSEVDMYHGLANNPSEIKDYDLNNEAKFKVYTLALFKIKNDIEKYIEGIIDIINDESDLDSEIVFFHEMLSEFDSVTKKLIEFVVSKNDDNIIENDNSNVYFALDALNRPIISKELLVDKNKSSIKTLLQKADSINNARIEGVRTYHMLGVEEEEKALGKTISMLTTSKMKLAYIVVNKNVLILNGTDNNNDRFDRIVRLSINRNLYKIEEQIAAIEREDLDYIELQNSVINSILGEEEIINVI